MPFTPEEEAALRVLIAQDPKIISDLESEVSLNGDEVLPIEDSEGTFGATVDDVKNYTKKKINESTSTATAAGTTTLTNSSTPVQIFTGTTTQTCVLPDGTTLKKDDRIVIQNESTGAVTTNFNGGSLAVLVPAKSRATLQIIDISTSAGTWILLLEPASPTRAGIVELATSAEIDTGTDDTRAITPAALLGSGYASFRRISRLTASSSSLLSLALSTGKKYLFDIRNILPATDGKGFQSQYSIDGGSTHVSANYLGAIWAGSSSVGLTSYAAAADKINLLGNYNADTNWGAKNTSTKGICGSLNIYEPSNAAKHKMIDFSVSWGALGGDFGKASGNASLNNATTAINEIMFYFDSGAIASGYIDVYEFN